MLFKKFFFTAAFCIILISANMYGAFAAPIKYAVKSDIIAYIDQTYISAYNLDDYTYITAEDLTDYGFHVVWNEDKRSLSINRIKGAVPIFTKHMWEKWKQDIESIGEQQQIFDSDIKTYLDGEPIESRCIDGRTIIKLRDLIKYRKPESEEKDRPAVANYGYTAWNEANRAAGIGIYLQELADEVNDAENLISGDYYLGDWYRYIGQIDEAEVPNGVGLHLMRSQTGVLGRTFIHGLGYLGDFTHGEKTGRTYKTELQNLFSQSRELYFMGDCQTDSYDPDSPDIAGREYIKSLRIRGGLNDTIMAHDLDLYYKGVYWIKNWSSGIYNYRFTRWSDGQGLITTLDADLNAGKIIFCEYYENNLIFTDTLYIDCTRYITNGHDRLLVGLV